MKPSAILPLLAAAALFAADTNPGPQPQIPRAAPELTIQMPGKQVHLSQYKGYVCVVAFMSTTCPHCQHLATVLSGLQQEYAPKGVQMLGVTINAEATTDLANFTAVYAKNMYPIGMSTEPIVRDFLEHPPGGTYFPMLAFLDKKGVIRAQHLGANEPAYFAQNTELQSIKGDLESIFKEPVIQLPPAKKK